ncbi:hypothetical protein P153DRAFT_325969 [Dothidotthia symphoricarpi CBS 119687]|uniref:Actin-like ATPase domain-containing protein n=1 Tax=Dothidotthia symphoricarpi CBS 119687 TaxID=1392245 RepID=A0A6A6A138_9PLEO|nr:uncharacterized protein P153DRAFT_325969 [Dothidotthia symphoricarpi CBS 119687]KAF2124677.1 hypothetical protein P153DRAFT_325969 [Dothidotthia symphoricarpi CBS 119687]
MPPATRSSKIIFSQIDPGPEPSYEDVTQDTDVEMTIEEEGENINEDYEMEHDPVSNIQEDRMIIAIDFGTTFSSVAYTVVPKGTPPERVDIRQVRCIGNYPGYEPPPGVLDFRQDVPTELWYDDGQVESRRQRFSNGVDRAGNPESEIEESSSSDDDDAEDGQSQSPFDDDGGLEARANIRHRDFRRTPATQYWGYGVQHKLSTMNIPRDEARPLTRFKLNLGHGIETDDVRTDIRTALKALKRKGIIQNDTDIYTHYLTHLLRHTKEQLLSSNELQQDMLIQFVLCVPAKWPVSACRTMQAALEGAVMDVGLSERDGHTVRNLFMISEPEAAAECILAEARSEVFRNETVVIVDAGGGTVDAVTYKCENSDPLRLSAEVVSPDSRLCGASYINERFEKKLLHKLASEVYLVKNGKTLKSIVQARTTIFENYQKRIIDITKREAPLAPIWIDDLRENRRKHFFQNVLELKRKTMSGFFEDSLAGVKEVLENQLELAESKNHRVEKIILTGGFSQSPSLQSYLRTYLAGRMNIRGWKIDLIVPQNPSTAVARGAVLRALNKRFGPSRITQCSYGILVSEPYEPDSIEAHRQTRCRINKADGEKYVDETIRWVIRAGERVENMQTFTFDVRHTFPLTRKKLVCAEQLWMSDLKHSDHYRKTHPLNKGAELIGSIEANLTFLKEDGLIQPQQPSEFSTHFGSQKWYWEVYYEVAMIVEGRSIRFEARWPVKGNLQHGQHQKVLVMKLVGIAAAFAPGTA